MSRDKQGADQSDEVPYVIDPVVVHLRAIIGEVFTQLSFRQAIEFSVEPESYQALHRILTGFLADVPV